MIFNFFDKIYFCGETDGSLTDGVSAITFPVAFALSIPLFRVGTLWILIPIVLIWFAMFTIVNRIYIKHGRRGNVLTHFRDSKYESGKLAYPMILIYWFILPAIAYAVQHFLI